MKTLNGGVIAGGNGKHNRVENDFYATNPSALEKLLLIFPFIKKYDKILEPCVGAGHLAQILSKHTNAPITSIDIVDRHYCPPKKDSEVHICDFLNYTTQEKYNLVVTNPPFSLAEEFIRKSLSLVKKHGLVVMFLKIQFLEGAKRKDFFDNFPPKYIYVFRRRMATFNNGNELNKDGKRWATTMCHAWFIWEKGYSGEPIVRWID